MALMGGTKAIRSDAHEWLPRFPGEDYDDWQIRVMNTTLTNVFKKTVSRLSSTPFAKPVTFDPDVDDRIGGVDGVGGWANNIDRSGTDVSTFARDLLVDLLVFGKCHIYIDYPPTGDAELSDADVERLDLRPFMRRISPKDLFAWDVESRGGSEFINELRWKEKVIERTPGNRFEEVTHDQIRVVRRDEIEIWRKAQGAVGSTGARWLMIEQYPVIMPLPDEEQQIPFVTIYANKQAAMVSYPPLEDLADLNLKHVRIDSDLQRILHVNCTPFMLATGFAPKELEDTTIAPNTIIQANNPGADMKYVEHTGASIALIQTSLDKVQEDMERMSLEMVSRSGGEITATEKAITTAEQTSELQEIVRNMESGITHAFQVMMLWAGEDNPQEVVIGTEIASDFGLVYRSESDLQLLIQLFAADAITHETLLQEAKCRGLLNEALEVGEEAAKAKKERDDLAPPVAPPAPVPVPEEE